MAPTLIPRMLRGSLTPVWDALEREEHHFTAEDVQVLFEACAVASLLLDRIREDYGTILGKGIDGRRLASELGETVMTLETVTELFDRVWEVATNESPPFEDKETRLLELKESRRRVAELHGKCSSLSAWLAKPPPKVEAVVLERAKQGPFVSIDEVLARSKADKEE